jgi:hypothetical protein
MVLIALPEAAGWPGLKALELPTFLQFVIGWQSLAGVSLGDGCLAVK